MHDDMGAYTAWLKLTLDTEEYFSGFLKNVPFVDISMDQAGVYKTMFLYLRWIYEDPTASDIPDGQDSYLADTTDADKETGQRY